MKLATLYVVFAAMSTVVNLGSQAVLLRLLSADYKVFIALVIGTGVGLLTKYLLDKRWIFQFQTTSKTHEARTFTIYTVFSLLTTLVFWGFELGALWVFKSETAQMIGGLVGLAIGYIWKYWLDKKYTFVHKKEAQSA